MEKGNFIEEGLPSKGIHLAVKPHALEIREKRGLFCNILKQCGAKWENVRKTCGETRTRMKGCRRKCFFPLRCVFQVLEVGGDHVSDASSEPNFERLPQRVIQIHRRVHEQSPISHAANNHTAHNQSYKNHRNGIKKPDTLGRKQLRAQRGMDPKFLRNQKWSKRHNNGGRGAKDAENEE